jgi:succinate dehydrogenase / fumarate reductase cytochrome b subunit
MSWFSKTMTSSLGKKFVMSLTGLFLCSFLLVHLIGNLQLLKSDNGEAFNLYAVFMTTNPVIKTTSYLLYASILGHAFWGIYLVFKNKAARPQGYAVVNNQSKWASRNMGILGTIVLVFIVAHMGDFWWEYKFEKVPLTRYKLQGDPVNETFSVLATDVTNDPNYSDPYYKYLETTGNKVLRMNEFDFITKDLYKETKEAFEEPLLVLAYIFAMFAISFHLQHGFQSAFQSLGLNHKKYTPTIKCVGFFFAIIVPLAFAAIPVLSYLKIQF